MQFPKGKAGFRRCLILHAGAPVLSQVEEVKLWAGVSMIKGAEQSASTLSDVRGRGRRNTELSSEALLLSFIINTHVWTEMHFLII